jgi:hypothetical protein
MNIYNYSGNGIAAQSDREMPLIGRIVTSPWTPAVIGGIVLFAVISEIKKMGTEEKEGDIDYREYLAETDKKIAKFLAEKEGR